MNPEDQPENSPGNRQQTGKKNFDPSIGKETQFKPGQSGNPAGRPKKSHLTEVAEEMLEEKLGDEGFRKQFKEAMWRDLLSGKVMGAMTRDTLWERTEGKVAQPVRVSGELTVSLADEVRKARERAEDEK